MWQSLKRPCAWMLAGGLLVGAGLAFGLWIGTQSSSNRWADAFPDLPERVLHTATAASVGDSFALATGAIDEDAEGVFVLDFLTGNLRCAVLNHRTGKFSALFQANVARDLGVTKNGKYQIVTGIVNFNRGASVFQPSLSVVYVLDSNSGNMIAYGIPWRREAATTGQRQFGALVPIDGMKVRTISVREQ